MVYNYGGTVWGNLGTEFFSVDIQTENADITRQDGFTAYKDRNWLGQGDRAEVIITPYDGYVIDSLDLPDGVEGQRNEDGSWTLTLQRPYTAISLSLTATMMQVPGSDMIPPSVGTEPEETVPADGTAPEVPVSDTAYYNLAPAPADLHWPASEPVNVTVTIDLTEDAFTLFNLEVSEQIKTAPENGTVQVDAEEWEGFQRIVFEALKERPDVTLTVDCRIDGERVEVTVPAGFELPEIFTDEVVSFKQIREWIEESV